MATVKLTLKKSLIGRLKKQKLTANSLGLKKIGDSKIVEKDAVMDGKINVISHLISVEDVK
ncbi:50S ribosomal protein L30 [Eubacteriales bacterium OttesenSCG-928-G02]|nr:50S ribosomal protein L30 [Eubacteriales bacterium OttesenSCG-928-G02]